MNRISVILRYLIAYIFLVVAMYVLLNTLGFKLMKNSLIKAEQARLTEQARILVDDYLLDYYGASLKIDEVESYLGIAAEASDTVIWMMNNQSVIIVDTDKYAAYVKVNNYITDFLDKPSITDLYVEGITRNNVLAVTVPVKVGGSQKGYLSLLKDMDSIYSNGVYYTDFVNVCVLAFLPIMFIVVVILYVTAIYPIQKLTRSTKNFVESKFKDEFVGDYPHELATLGGTVKYMGNRLKNTDEVQRKFLSNVSHDFRSPLTSIRGYLEAMKDGTIPVEQQEKYFDIVLYETDRLTKLTSNLLQLNNIDDNGLMLHIEIFDINHMIRQISQTFEGICKKRKIKLRLEFYRKEALVSADPDRIQQVIYNLLDNAIKFSSDDSEITLSTEEKGNKVFVGVKDRGRGISKDAIGKIWERFYKEDTSRGRDKKGSGLGLSIVKEIIDAHNQNISVVSTEGVGTEFIFTLKSAL